MIKYPAIATLVSAALLFCSCAVIADNELTLSLETPELSSAAPVKDSRADATAVEIPTKKTPAPKKTDGVVVGKVGIVSVSVAYIYVSKSAAGRKYAVVRMDTPLAVVRDEGDWYGVLMTNKSIGWIPSKNVRMSDYNLVAKKPETQPAVSRGGTASRMLSCANELIKAAMRYSGVPYVYGGTSPTSGMDCSAYVRSVFSKFGVNLPRTAREQAKVGTPVPFDQLQPGDRLYFACYNPSVDHCGIYAGNGYFIHCSSSRKGVAFDTLASNFFWRSLVAARRS